MKTTMLQLPAVLVHAIQDFDFTDKPIWRIGEGLKHVKVELTFKLPTNQPTSVDRVRKNRLKMSKGAENRTKKHAPPAGEWPRQPLAAEKPANSQPALRHTAPPPTATVTSPAAPTVTDQRPPSTKPSPTMPPLKKLPRLESRSATSQQSSSSPEPAPPPMITEEPVLRETKYPLKQAEPVSIQLPPTSIDIRYYDYTLLEHFQVEAIRNYDHEIYYLLRRKGKTYKKQYFAKYDEPSHAVFVAF